MLPLWLAAAIETESDRSKMEQLYDEYERRLYSVAFRYLHDKYRAEDAVHDVFINLIPKLDSISEIKCPQTWAFLVTITENICLNMLTRKSYTSEVYDVDDKDQLLVESLPDSYINTEDAYFDQYDYLQVADAVRQLPDILKETMILYAIHGYTMKEIAAIQGCSLESIKKRIQRGRAKIITILGGER